MRDDHDASWELRVLATGCRVKKGGKELWGGKANEGPCVVVEGGVGVGFEDG